MKYQFFLLIVMLFTSGCIIINTTTPQISHSIHESKNNGFFIARYICIVRPDTLIKVGEAWVENTWWNTVQYKFFVKKKPIDRCNMIFEVLYCNKENLYEYTIEDIQNGQPFSTIGIGKRRYGKFDVSNCVSQDTIRLSIRCCGDFPKQNNGLPHPEIGTMTFIKLK